MIYNKDSKINDYLFFGYTLDRPFDFQRLEDVGLIKLKDYSDDTLISLFKDIMSDCLPDESTFNKCIIPLSGGWDSRLLLGAALNKYPKSKIVAVTYGTPGQLDFELGKLISKECGIKHVEYDLNKEKVSWEKLIDTAKLSPWTYVPDGFYNYRMLDLITENSENSENSENIVLSGFMGDPLTGGHISDSEDYKNALCKFIAKQRKSRTLYLPRNNYAPLSDVCAGDFASKFFDYDEVYDIAIRQVNCIAPIVTFRKNSSPWETKFRVNSNLTMITPFSDLRWASFWSQTGKENKIGQKQYFNLILRLYPELYKLPSKINYGASFDGGKINLLTKKLQSKTKIFLNKISPKYFSKNKAPINYIDFDEAFRKREDFKDVLEFAISYLEEMNVVPWIDINNIREAHEAYKKNHGDALLILVGLAVNLYAESGKG